MLKYLLEKGMIDGSCMTVTGKTMAENLAGCPPLSEGQDVRHPEPPLEHFFIAFRLGFRVCPKPCRLPDSFPSS